MPINIAINGVDVDLSAGPTLEGPLSLLPQFQTIPVVLDNLGNHTLLLNFRFPMQKQVKHFEHLRNQVFGFQKIFERVHIQSFSHIYVILSILFSSLF